MCWFKKNPPLNLRAAQGVNLEGTGTFRDGGRGANGSEDLTATVCGCELWEWRIGGWRRFDMPAVLAPPANEVCVCVSVWLEKVWP